MLTRRVMSAAVTPCGSSSRASDALNCETSKVATSPATVMTDMTSTLAMEGSAGSDDGGGCGFGGGDGDWGSDGGGDGSMSRGIEGYGGESAGGEGEAVCLCGG